MKTRRCWGLTSCLTLCLGLSLLALHYANLATSVQSLLANKHRDVLFSYIGDKNGEFRPTIEHLNTFVRSFRAHNKEAKIVLFFTDDHRKGQMKVCNAGAKGPFLICHHILIV